MGTTIDVYTSWARKNGRPVTIDDLGNGGSLMWFTDRRKSGKVVFYLHGNLESRYLGLVANWDDRWNISASPTRLCSSFLAIRVE